MENSVMTGFVEGLESVIDQKHAGLIILCHGLACLSEPQTALSHKCVITADYRRKAMTA